MTGLGVKSDDFKGNPYGAATNQCGHFAIGLALPVYLGFAGWFAVPLAALAYWVLVEFFAQRLALWRDAVMDTAHVMAGAAFGAAALRFVPDGDITAQLVFSVWVALLAFEAWSKR